MHHDILRRPLPEPGSMGNALEGRGAPRQKNSYTFHGNKHPERMFCKPAEHSSEKEPFWLRGGQHRGVPPNLDRLLATQRLHLLGASGSFTAACYANSEAERNPKVGEAVS